MIKEVLTYTLTAPYTYLSGLIILSELLPLPLPIQSREVQLAALPFIRYLIAVYFAKAQSLRKFTIVVCLFIYVYLCHSFVYYLLMVANTRLFLQ